MISLTRPNAGRLQKLREACRTLPLTYAPRGTPPAGWVVDRNRIGLGRGRETFERACAALRAWVPLRLGWVEPCWPRAGVAVGEVVGTLARYAGVWWVNPCRIVAVEDRTTPEGRRRFGLSYATLPGHVARGEEGFTVEWNPADGAVSYEILAYSRPALWVARLGHPLMRRQQRRFAADSLRAMIREVGPCVAPAVPDELHLP